MLATSSSSFSKRLCPHISHLPWGCGGLSAGGKWGPRQLRPHEEKRKMPAELLLLMIVAFANPSCQVLSSLRMGEAPAPHLLRNSPFRSLQGTQA